MKNYLEDILVICGAVILLILIIIFGHSNNPPVFQSYNPQPPKIFTKPVPVAFKSPNKTQLKLDYPYQRGNVTYEVEQGNTSSFNGSVTVQSYYVIYVNLTPEPITINSSSLDIGCIAANDQTYHSNDSIFDGSLDDSLVLESFYNPLTVTINVPGSCQYIGTEDGQYYWPAE